MSETFFNGPLAQLLRQAILPSPPDPWSAELDAEVGRPDATALCVSCLCPQEPPSWLCPNCGYPTGNYVAAMPYMNVFLDGELFRRGVSGPPEPGIGRILFLVVYSSASYGPFAPVYWFWMVRKARGRPICTEYRRLYVVRHQDENG